MTIIQNNEILVNIVNISNTINIPADTKRTAPE